MSDWTKIPVANRKTDEVSASRLDRRVKGQVLQVSTAQRATAGRTASTRRRASQRSRVDDITIIRTSAFR